MQSTHPRQRVCGRIVGPLIITFITTLALVLLLVAGGCGGDEGSIVGKWQDSEGYTFEFTADGKFVSEDTEGLNMTYVVEGNEISFKSGFGGGITMEFSLDGDTLEIEDPETGEFDTATRVK